VGAGLRIGRTYPAAPVTDATATIPTRPTLGDALRTAGREGALAGKANLRPAVILWLAAVAIVLGYYFVPPFREVLVEVGVLKDRFGFLYSAVATMFFAAVLPIVLGRLFKIMPMPSGRGWLFLLVFWAERGMEVDAFYRLQGWLFGVEASVGTVAAKVAVDQLLYAPLWAVPSMLIVYRFKDGKGWPRGGLGKWFVRDALPIIVANNVVWVPAVTAVYLLPTPLQLPMANIVSCLWVLVFSYMHSRQSAA
jgi:hypothetical protein